MRESHGDWWSSLRPARQMPGQTTQTCLKCIRQVLLPVLLAEINSDSVLIASEQEFSHKSVQIMHWRHYFFVVLNNIIPSFHNPSNHLLNSFSNKDVFFTCKISPYCISAAPTVYCKLWESVLLFWYRPTYVVIHCCTPLYLHLVLVMDSLWLRVQPLDTTRPQTRHTAPSSHTTPAQVVRTHSYARKQSQPELYVEAKPP